MLSAKPEHDGVNMDISVTGEIVESRIREPSRRSTLLQAAPLEGR
jgi:hypothetical protein